ncbi:MAG TPA: GNAT family N-acetyltransferase [Ornithinimicrobium sp.]|uniref:GNAT family N-acetyltransferase n=1 Tax=Ornithinimicrobium sp. TaxID=1977084 RepID=UPI002B46A59D|nr:GNAT family N-acetyltransferase [Ornithinimicrobium sp.]HKJ12533.1 GNAT family N-acetyltransferase [Ornithinimicrobium sp.]
MAVTQASRVDARVVASLLVRFNAEFDTPTPPVDVLERRLAWMLDRDDVFVLLGGDRDAPTGFALVTLRPTAYDDGPLAVLDELYVVPHLRGQGLGMQLLDSMFAELGRRGCHEVHINVDEQDLDTRRFYEAHGFTNLQPGADERMLCYIQEI